MKFDWSAILSLILKLVMALLAGGGTVAAMHSAGYQAGNNTVIGMDAGEVKMLGGFAAALVTFFLTPLLGNMKGTLGLGMTPEEHGWLEALYKDKFPPKPTDKVVG
jgi:hypothetical protein